MSGLGRALRRMRLLRNMKQSHLAEFMGVNQATVSRWECGLLAMSEAQEASVRRLLAVSTSAQDAALKRLVESSTLKVHLVCDRTHQLLAVSPARRAEWRLEASELLGKSLLVYASPEILLAEAKLGELGWQEGQVPSLTVDTGPNADPAVPIRPGRMLWERIVLADGTAGRLVTTLR